MKIMRILPLAVLVGAGFASANTIKIDPPKPAPAPAVKPAPAPQPTQVTPAPTPTPAPAPTPAPEAIKFATEREKFSYAIGLDVGESLKRIEYPIDIFQLYKGLYDMLQNDSAHVLLSQEERREVLTQLTAQIRQAMAVKDSLAAIDAVNKAKDFLAKNKKAKGVVTTASGLQYSIVKAGTGASPKAGSEVTAHYVGTLLDGTEFDSSVKRGQPATFTLDRVIKGWQEMLPLMKVGEKVKCWIPPALAYGPRAAGRIPSNSLLIFEVTLIDVKAGAAATATPAPAGKPAVKPAAVK